ncbi:alkaline phosphatase family protein [Robiginitalea biformata]|uniref:alkaline phosphatase family protein n=1 Tax=Robiginitalea biformata TaxID=252307 RepID=UPI003B5B8BA0
MGSIRLIFLLLLTFPVSHGQSDAALRPKLVVGVVVDQMRFDYLEKYRENFGDGGFLRLLREGYSFENMQYDYIPTVTAAGHASIYTGTTPSGHGIIGNSWYDRDAGRIVDNVGDTTVQIIGSLMPNGEGRSPARLMAPTFSDRLREWAGPESRIISISLKDRGAILPGGHQADAAYWHDWETSPGYFVSSTYYMDALPAWVEDFNAAGLSENYMHQTWTPLLPMEAYKNSAPDDNPYEVVLKGKDAPVFPYDLAAMRSEYGEGQPYHNILWATPYGNELVREFALRALRSEELGKDSIPDFLGISFSTPDVAGHTFGPQSVEMADIYLRLDRDIAQLLQALDKEVGQGRYLLFLTSDHGVHPVVSQAQEQGLPAGLAVLPRYRQDLMFHLSLRYGAFDWIESFGTEQIYLNRKLAEEKGVPLAEIQQVAAAFMAEQPGVRYALTASDLAEKAMEAPLPAMLQKGFYANRSGDVLLVYEPGYAPTMNYRIAVSEVRGATHGSGYAFDTHVPLLWFGAGIPQGSTDRLVHPANIVPTLTRVLNLTPLPGAAGQPLDELLD